MPLDAHQPHSARSVQSPQMVASKHGSAAEHSEVNQAHSKQTSPSGPVESPAMQEPSSPQKPQGYSPVQLPQSVLSPQVSGPVEHSKETQLQSAQVPVVGPPDEPAWHPLPSHQPHPASPVQVSQSAPPQVLPVGSQALAYQSQLVHDPVSGPETEPGPQLPVSAHQPQGAVPVQVPQVVNPHSVAGAVHVPPVQVSPPVQRSPVQQV